MEQFKEFVLKHFKVITVVLTFVLTMYIQHLNNTRQIEELLNKCEVLDTKIKYQYERIDTIKLDKAVFRLLSPSSPQYRTTCTRFVKTFVYFWNIMRCAESSNDSERPYYSNYFQGTHCDEAR